jgi:hypothetical protein
MLGYAAEEYARSLAEFGEPLPLPQAGGWLLARELPGGIGRDAAGCYPLFACGEWNSLAIDLIDLPKDVIAVSLVADPAAKTSLSELRGSFPDVCYHYKDHYFADLSRPLTEFVAGHHQRNVRQAARTLGVQRLENPRDHLTIWNTLYAELVERHQIRGIAAFSPAAFAGLMQVPGLRAYAALQNDEIVGMVLWLVSETTAYYHLAAYSAAGYNLKASFALFWHCLEAFAAEGIPWAALGGGAGTFAASEGLSRFKEGWSTETRPAYFCGRILDQDRYAELSAKLGSQNSTYFPAYRAPLQRSAA